MGKPGMNAQLIWAAVVSRNNSFSSSFFFLPIKTLNVNCGFILLQKLIIGGTNFEMKVLKLQNSPEFYPKLENITRPADFFFCGTPLAFHNLSFFPPPQIFCIK